MQEVEKDVHAVHCDASRLGTEPRTMYNGSPLEKYFPVLMYVIIDHHHRFISFFSSFHLAEEKEEAAITKPEV
jgi:hypothetical protein